MHQLSPEFCTTTNAWAMDWRTDNSAIPILNFPFNERTRYLASGPWHKTNMDLILSVFFVMDLDYKANNECLMEEWILNSIDYSQNDR